jgi:hypothetical protein
MRNSSSLFNDGPASTCSKTSFPLIPLAKTLALGLRAKADFEWTDNHPLPGLSIEDESPPKTKIGTKHPTMTFRIFHGPDPEHLGIRRICPYHKHNLT